MCVKCWEAVKRHYPYLSEEECGEILMSATSFPFGDPEYIEKQIIELISKTDGTVNGACVFAQHELDRQYDEWKESQFVGPKLPEVQQER